MHKNPWRFTGNQYGPWIDAYTAAPNLFLLQYSDGSWGYYAPNQDRAENSARNLAMGGVAYRTTATINTNFPSEQDLKMILKGFKFSGNVSLDNTFVENNREVNDLNNDT